MLKFASVLSSAAYAVSVEPERGAHKFQGKPSFSIGHRYKEPDYTQDYGESLPGADFNRQVYKFNEDKQIWDQNDYIERTRQEAEILVALEALKTSAAFLVDDTY